MTTALLQGLKKEQTCKPRRVILYRHFDGFSLSTIIGITFFVNKLELKLQIEFKTNRGIQP